MMGTSAKNMVPVPGHSHGPPVPPTRPQAGGRTSTRKGEKEKEKNLTHHLTNKRLGVFVYPYTSKHDVVAWSRRSAAYMYMQSANPACPTGAQSDASTRTWTYDHPPQPHHLISFTTNHFWPPRIKESPLPPKISRPGTQIQIHNLRASTRTRQRGQAL